MIPGIDVSTWQDRPSTPQHMDFNKAVDQGTVFVFVKASERMFKDADHIWNWANAGGAGLLRGAYHYLRYDVHGAKQARFFCNDALNGDYGVLPLVCDYEAPGANSNSKVILEQFLVETETITGRVPMIYTSYGHWSSWGSREPKWLKYPLWQAHYTSASQPMALAPWGRNWLFWQYGVFPVGYEYGAESPNLDLNWFNGSLEELYALANISEPPTPAPEKDKIEIVGRLLWGRSEAKFVSSAKKVMTRRGEVYEKAGKKKKSDGIWWWPIKVKEQIVWVSAGRVWTKEVE